MTGHRLSSKRLRLLDGLPSLKAKLSILIVAAVAVTALTSVIGLRFGWPVWVRPVVSAGVALAMVQLLARGLTRPSPACKRPWRTCSTASSKRPLS